MIVKVKRCKGQALYYQAFYVTGERFSNIIYKVTKNEGMFAFYYFILFLFCWKDLPILFLILFEAPNCSAYSHILRVSPLVFRASVIPCIWFLMKCSVVEITVACCFYLVLMPPVGIRVLLLIGVVEKIKIEAKVLDEPDLFRLSILCFIQTKKEAFISSELVVSFSVSCEFWFQNPRKSS